MKNHYNRPEWRAFRSEALRLHDGVCVRCSRGPADGVVLQVHHKVYFSGRLPWQYTHDECEALCKGCHAEEHGLVRPQSGWEHFGFCDDLGGLDGECELCGTAIRYVFPVHHAKWGTMEVGEICCDHLTTGTFASAFIRAQRRLIDRRKRFVSSPRWHFDKARAPCIIQDDIVVSVVRDGSSFRLKLNGITGKRDFNSIMDAKIAAFDSISSDRVKSFLAKKRLRTSASSYPFL